MGKQVGVWFRAAMLLAAMNCVLAEDKYFAVNGTLELRPEHTAAITSILWKHKGNLVAESLGSELTYYGAFKVNGRTTLDKTTGLLKINNMREADAGLYSVEINNNVQSTTYEVKMIKEVPKPVVWVQPVACNGGSTTCTLSCDGETAGAEPVTYSWKKGAGDWKESNKTMNINETMTDVKTYACKMKNPVSEQESEPKDNPFYMAAQTGSSTGGIVAGVIFVIFLIGLTVAGFVLFKKGIIQKFLNDRQRVPTNPPPGTNGQAASSAKSADGLTDEL